jgi:hypothetical protein
VRNWRLSDLAHYRGCSWHNISVFLRCKQIFLRAENDMSLIRGPRRGRGGNRSSVDLVVTRLWAGRSRVRIPVRARDLPVVHNIHTGSGAHTTDAAYTRNANIATPRPFTLPFWCLFNRKVMLVKCYYAVSYKLNS